MIIQSVKRKITENALSSYLKNKLLGCCLPSVMSLSRKKGDTSRSRISPPSPPPPPPPPYMVKRTRQDDPGVGSIGGRGSAQGSASDRVMDHFRQSLWTVDDGSAAVSRPPSRQRYSADDLLIVDRRMVYFDCRRPSRPPRLQRVACNRWQRFPVVGPRRRIQLVCSILHDIGLRAFQMLAQAAMPMSV